MGQPRRALLAALFAITRGAAAADARLRDSRNRPGARASAKRRVIGNAAITIAFDPPNRPWIQALKGPAVNLFLFDIKENPHRRDVMYEKVLGAEGTVVARRPPPPRIDLHYTVSAWAPTVLVEHKILAAALRCFCSMPALPRDTLPAALAALPYEVLISTESGAKRSMFLTLGGELKTGFEVTVTVPMPGLADIPVAPPVQQQATVAVNPVPGADPARTVVARETVQRETVQPEAVQPETVQREAVQREAVQREAVQPETVQK
jgi:hypothetical protein